MLRSRRLVSITSKMKNSMGQVKIKRWWNEGDATPPSFPTSSKKSIECVRVTLVSEPHTRVGYSKASRGHLWWLKYDVDDFCKSHPKVSEPRAKRAASEASRERSELVTTSIWCCCHSANPFLLPGSPCPREGGSVENFQLRT